ncbi:CMP/dCMP deaminase, zinc-binding protein [Metarhizium album ARSEF 1941]|uniref:CMP/dCMP deaminase, zinc-binding protein n=1 Tax=Metarhizium album (strain ARSEF 1941) TaxID=1081103 RepID=A0A0B2X561_METAS|nr:CMP/dCMP deaminase, zinc-binding protein [Metarhizium album ARSEF 1941]KHO00436.1 CMP/dCMP deaminase, zinc-binding protein [Metarhizium album ARSEF 1941]
MAVADPWLSQEDKENRPPEKHDDAELVAAVKKVVIDDTKDVEVVVEDPAVLAERAHHLRFIEEALDMARLALRTNETPVGCVLVHNGTVIAKGMNATNVTRNGTRHAEFMAISALLSEPLWSGPRQTSLRPKNLPRPSLKTPDDASDASSVDSKRPDEGNEDGKKGHLYPYGQKLHPARRVSRDIIRECILYVTVEPCVMCASLLRQLGIKKVYFGAVNDKFGGAGGVFSIHANSLPVREDGKTASAHPTPRPSQLPDGSGTLGTSYPLGGGDGGNVEEGYEIEGGWGRDEAVALLRRFYVQENGRAPVPRKKEGRAARLAAMMEKDEEAGVETPTADEGQGQDEGHQQEDAVDENHDAAMMQNNSSEKTQANTGWMVT